MRGRERLTVCPFVTTNQHQGERRTIKKQNPEIQILKIMILCNLKISILLYTFLAKIIFFKKAVTEIVVTSSCAFSTVAAIDSVIDSVTAVLMPVNLSCSSSLDAAGSSTSQ